MPGKMKHLEVRKFVLAGPSAARWFRRRPVDRPRRGWCRPRAGLTVQLTGEPGRTITAEKKLLPVVLRSEVIAGPDNQRRHAVISCRLEFLLHRHPDRALAGRRMLGESSCSTGKASAPKL